MHRGWEISGYHDVQDIGSSRGVLWVSGWRVRPKDKTGVPIGIVTQEFPLSRAQPRVPVDMFGVQVAGHQDRQPAAKASVQVRSDQRAGLWEKPGLTSFIQVSVGQPAVPLVSWQVW